MLTRQDGFLQLIEFCEQGEFSSVQVVASLEPRTCLVCLRHDGRRLSIIDALMEEPLPCHGCTCPGHFGASAAGVAGAGDVEGEVSGESPNRPAVPGRHQRSGCGCTYVGIHWDESTPSDPLRASDDARAELRSKLVGMHLQRLGVPTPQKEGEAVPDQPAR